MGVGDIVLFLECCRLLRPRLRLLCSSTGDAELLGTAEYMLTPQVHDIPQCVRLLCSPALNARVFL